MLRMEAIKRWYSESTRENNDTIPKFLSGQLMRPLDACDNQVSSSLTQQAHSPVQRYNKMRTSK